MISRVCELRSNADADRYVGAFFLAISNIGVGADFQAAFNGGVLVELEDHSLGTGQVLLEVLSFTGGLRLSHGKSKGILLYRSDLSRYGLLLCSRLAVRQA